MCSLAFGRDFGHDWPSIGNQWNPRVNLGRAYLSDELSHFPHWLQSERDQKLVLSWSVGRDQVSQALQRFSNEYFSLERISSAEGSSS